jgi:chorismate lyase
MDRVRWHEARAWRHLGLSTTGAACLLDRGSLTQRLQQISAAPVQVKVLRQYWDYPTNEERQLLPFAPRHYARLREVYLGNGQQHWVFARTVLPESLLTGKYRYLKHWGEKPLGDILFSHPSLIRQQLQIAQIPILHPLLKNIRTDVSDTYLKNNSFFWARRSLFYLEKKPFLILEVFLPSLSCHICLC